MAIILRFQLHSAHYTVLLLIKNAMRNASAINPVIQMIPVTNVGKPTYYHKFAPCTVGKKKWDTKEDKGKPMMHALYVLGMPKGTCLTEVTSSNGGRNFSYACLNTFSK